ncbi:hypothetical protein ACOMHN_019797 [Nucella lapillus]
MAERCRAELAQLMREDGNSECADCGDADPDWASVTMGVFLCHTCAGVHRSLGTQSRVKSVRLDNWDRDQVQVMEAVGNKKAKDKFEMCVPLFYRKPTKKDVDVLKKEWILAKYQREEFTDPDKQSAYNCSHKEGMLWKLGRDRKQFQQRKFVLSRAENKFSYFVNEDSKQKPQQPKAEADMDHMNAIFVPEKIGNPYGLQITFIKNGSTRSLFVYSENSRDIVDWYNCVRAAKWERRRIAFPDRDLHQLAEDLTKDFIVEGWLSKMGPKNEPFKRRWFTLDRRKLMYFEEPLNAFPKGEVFIGHRDAGYTISLGAPEGDRSSNSHNNYCFTLHTPERNFILRAETQDDMDKWNASLSHVTDLPLTPQDSKLASMLNPKKSSNSFRIIRR